MTTPDTRPGALRLFNALLGISTLLILLQGLWAGLFVREGEGYKDKWVEWHARGADLAIVLMLVATVAVFVKLRERKDLWGGGAVVSVLLILEGFLGGRIRDNGDQGLTTVHLPLAMLLMAGVVFLATRGATRDR